MHLVKNAFCETYKFTFSRWKSFDSFIVHLVKIICWKMILSNVISFHKRGTYFFSQTRSTYVMKKHLFLINKNSLDKSLYTFDEKSISWNVISWKTNRVIQPWVWLCSAYARPVNQNCGESSFAADSTVSNFLTKISSWRPKPKQAEVCQNCIFNWWKGRVHNLQLT